MNDKFVTVYSNLFIASVDLVKSVLEGENILCNVKGYDSSGETTAFGQGRTVIELQVPEKDRKKAEDIIKSLKIS
jgi:hypothetical protein